MKPLVMMLGLAGLGGFSYASWDSLHDGVAQQLTTKAQAAIDASDLEGVTVSFDHLDGIVKGATTDEAQQKAKEVILAALPAGRVSFEGGDGMVSGSAADDMGITSSTDANSDQIASLNSQTQIGTEPLGTISIDPPTETMDDPEPPAGLVATEPDSLPDLNSEANLVPTVSPVEASAVDPIAAASPEAPEPTTSVEPIDIAKATPAEPSPELREAESHRVAATDLEAQRVSKLKSDAARLDQDTEARLAKNNVVADTPPTLNSPNAGNKKKPRLGIYIEADIESTLVRYVDPNSAADKAGIRIGDKVVRLGGESISNFDDLEAVVNKFSAGDEVEIWYRRDGALNRTKATLLERVEPQSKKDSSEEDTSKADEK